MGITSAYSPKENKWHRKWPESISQHDIVYLSPPDDPILGLPIGNGDLGGLLWTEDSKLMVAVNKCDTWDDSPKQEFRNWAKDEVENQTSLRHCCRVAIDFKMPVFDLLYQEDFEARIDLASAAAHLQATTPFSKIKLTSYVSHESKVMVICCDVEFKEEVSPEILVERWGSRTFAGWYLQVKRDPSVGLDGTETTVTDQTIMIHQNLRKIDFAVGVRVSGEVYGTKRQHSRAGVITLKPSKKQRFYLYIAVATSENAVNPEEEVEVLLNRATDMGETQILQQHQLEWKYFWDKSFISLPENYIENIWYIILYYANSSSRGGSPPHFANGLWGFNRDFVPWNYYFHWNMQYYIAPLYAANHSELAMPYHHFRHKQLSHTVDFAKKHKKKNGALYADVADRNGYNDLGTMDNNTPGSQIAMDFWKHYQYTGDTQFLEEIAWPVILETTRYYADFFVKGTDGRYHVHEAQAYEGSPLFDDTITDIAMAKALFPVALIAAGLVEYKEEELIKWQDINENIPDFRLVVMQEDELDQVDGILSLTGGLGRGKQVSSDQVFAVGKYVLNQGCQGMEEGDWVRHRYLHRESYYGIPDPEFAPVYPASLIGLADRSSSLFQSAVNQVYLHPYSALHERALIENGENEVSCCGWCPFPIVAARLGLDEDIVGILKETISKWQLHVQGFGHWGPYPDCVKDVKDRWMTKTVKDIDTEEQFPFPMWPFRHFYNEAMPIVSTAVNEMLLQSYDGTIRLFPATPQTWNVQYRLACVNGFIVNVEYKEGQVPWVCIESNSGKVCYIVNPLEKNNVCCVELGPEGEVVTYRELVSQLVHEDRILEFPTIKGNRYLIIQDKEYFTEWTVEPLKYERNRNNKQLGDARLGLPRMF